MMRPIIAMAVVVCVAFASASATEEINLRKYTYEPRTPKYFHPNDDVKVTASGQFSSMKPEYALDGEITSNFYWGCGRIPAWLQYEFPDERELKDVKIVFYYNDARVYQFYVERSLDGKTWTKVADWTKNQKPSTEKGFDVSLSPVGKARYMRITVTGGSRPEKGAHIVETIFGSVEREIPEGFHGCIASLDRIGKDNAIGDENQKVWRPVAWRNERVSGQISLWTRYEIPQVRMSVTDLKGVNGTIPASAVQTRFVRYVLGRGNLYPDVLDTAEKLDIPANGFRPIWLTVNVPASANPGIYRGKITVTGMGRHRLVFPVELTVLGAKLADPKEWKFFLDLWQHPWAVARYHGVKPFSPVHYALLEPIYRELANAGQKVLTTTITDLPWNHQNFDAYHSMVEHIKNPDGSWTQDYRVFDEFVAFGKKCGIGPDIHCYTMATWGNRVYYTDGKTGNEMMVTLVPGTPEHETFWGPFLTDFQKHLKEKGWLGNVYIAMDERTREQLKATADCVRKYAPGLKIAMPGNQSPSQFKGVNLENCSQYIVRVNDGYLQEAEARRKQGMITTFYVCCGPKNPNTFTYSPTSEQVWLGYYTAGTRLDGLLRWSFVNWPRDPLFDTSFWGWAPGDTFLIYPGPRSSIRWEMLRDGIEEYEKIRFLRESGADIRELEKILSTYNFKTDTKLSEDALREKVLKTRAAVEAASLHLK